MAFATCREYAVMIVMMCCMRMKSCPSDQQHLASIALACLNQDHHCAVFPFATCTSGSALRISFETRNEADLTLQFSSGALCIRLLAGVYAVYDSTGSGVRCTWGRAEPA